MLRECFDRHGTDKGSVHGYERVYEPLFRDLRDKPIRLLEIGILRGASLAAWLEYFPRAEVIGIDTFGRVPAEAVEVLKNPRVTWYVADTVRVSINVLPVDILIDDGYHTPSAQLATFRNFFPLVKPRGAYFIEDCPDDGTVQYRELEREVGKHHAKFHRFGGRWSSSIIEVRRAEPVLEPTRA